MKEFRESYDNILNKLTNPRKIRFFLRFIETGALGASYRWAFNKSDNPADPNYMRDQNASNLGKRILVGAGFTLDDFLCVMGHDDDRVASALDKLYATNPDKYLNHIETLRKLDQKTLEINAGEGVTINIVSARPKDTDEES